MEKEKKADEKPVENSQEGVKKDEGAPVVEETITLTKAEADSLVKAAEEATSLAAKKTADAENYKKGMLKYKSKLEEEGIVAEDFSDKKPEITEDRIAEIVRNTIQETLATQPKVDEDPLVLANKKIEEMKLVITNSKKSSLPSSAGSNLDKDAPVSTDAEKYFSPAQLAEIKQKYPNISTEDIIKNMTKPRGVAK